jgi:hypothetical protein
VKAASRSPTKGLVPPEVSSTASPGQGGQQEKERKKKRRWDRGREEKLPLGSRAIDCQPARDLLKNPNYKSFTYGILHPL